MLTETLTAVHDAGDSGQVEREVPWMGDLIRDVVLSYTDKELVRVHSVLTENKTLTIVHGAGDSGQVEREVPWIRENYCKMVCCHALIKSYGSPSAFCVD